MGKFLTLAVVVGAAVFAAVSLANTGSGGTTQPPLPFEPKTLDAHPMTTAQGKPLGFKASGKHRRFGIRYLFAEDRVPARMLGGGAIKCPKKWHPISGLFSTDSNRVVSAGDAPLSKRKWVVIVRNEASAPTDVGVGAVCEKGLNFPR